MRNIIMEHALTDEETIWLRDSPRDPARCIWSGELLHEDYPVVEFLSEDFYGVHTVEVCDVPYVNSLRRGLDSFDVGDNSNWVKLGRNKKIKYVPPSAVTTFKFDCLVCQKGFDHPDEGMFLIGKLGLHTECAEEFTTILQGVWEHSDDILRWSI